jgi:hypothetical protein
MQYFFRLLDIEKIGALTANSVRYLFRDVARRMAEFGFEPPRIDDVKVEINRFTHKSHALFPFCLSGQFCSNYGRFSKAFYF